MDTKNKFQGLHEYDYFLVLFTEISIFKVLIHIDAQEVNLYKYNRGC